jgi:hypothetical protein
MSLAAGRRVPANDSHSCRIVAILWRMNSASRMLDPLSVRVTCPSMVYVRYVWRDVQPYCFAPMRPACTASPCVAGIPYHALRNLG